VALVRALDAAAYLAQRDAVLDELAAARPDLTGGPVAAISELWDRVRPLG
jgi:hypothetical protein